MPVGGQRSVATAHRELGEPQRVGSQLGAQRAVAQAHAVLRRLDAQARRRETPREERRAHRSGRCQRERRPAVDDGAGAEERRDDLQRRGLERAVGLEGRVAGERGGSEPDAPVDRGSRDLERAVDCVVDHARFQLQAFEVERQGNGTAQHDVAGLARERDGAVETRRGREIPAAAQPQIGGQRRHAREREERCERHTGELALRVEPALRPGERLQRHAAARHARFSRSSRKACAVERNGHRRGDRGRISPLVLERGERPRPPRRHPAALDAAFEIEGLAPPLHCQNVALRGSIQARAQRLEARALLQSEGGGIDGDVDSRLLQRTAQPPGGVKRALQARIELGQALRFQRELENVTGLPEVSVRPQRVGARGQRYAQIARAARGNRARRVALQANAAKNAVTHQERSVGMPFGEERARNLELAVQNGRRIVAELRDVDPHERCRSRKLSGLCQRHFASASHFARPRYGLKLAYRDRVAAPRCVHDETDAAFAQFCLHALIGAGEPGAHASVQPRRAQRRMQAAQVECGSPSGRRCRRWR